MNLLNTELRIPESPQIHYEVAPFKVVLPFKSALPDLYIFELSM